MSWSRWPKHTLWNWKQTALSFLCCMINLSQHQLHHLKLQITFQFWHFQLRCMFLGDSSHIMSTIVISSRTDFSSRKGFWKDLRKCVYKPFLFVFIFKYLKSFLTETKLWVDRPSSVVFAQRFFCGIYCKLMQCLGAWLHFMTSLLIHFCICTVFVFLTKLYLVRCIAENQCFNAISWLPAALSDLGSASAVCRLCSLLTFTFSYSTLYTSFHFHFLVFTIIHNLYTQLYTSFHFHFFVYIHNLWHIFSLLLDPQLSFMFLLLPFTFSYIHIIAFSFIKKCSKVDPKMRK